MDIRYLSREAAHDNIRNQQLLQKRAFDIKVKKNLDLIICYALRAMLDTTSIVLGRILRGEIRFWFATCGKRKRCLERRENLSTSGH